MCKGILSESLLAVVCSLVCAAPVAHTVVDFSFFLQETIKTNKDLDLPTEKEMLAMFRCEEIMESAYAGFAAKFAPIRTQVNYFHM